MISSTSSQSFRLKKSDIKHYKQLISKKSDAKYEWMTILTQSKKETDLRPLTVIQIWADSAKWKEGEERFLNKYTLNWFCFEKTSYAVLEDWSWMHSQPLRKKKKKK